MLLLLLTQASALIGLTILVFRLSITGSGILIGELLFDWYIDDDGPEVKAARDWEKNVAARLGIPKDYVKSQIDSDHYGR